MEAPNTPLLSGVVAPEDEVSHVAGTSGVQRGDYPSFLDDFAGGGLVQYDDTGFSKPIFASRLSADQLPPTAEEVRFASKAAVGGGKALSWTAASCVVKCVVGGGSFYLPYGVLNAGIAGGFVGLVLFGLLTGWLAVVVLGAKRLVHPVEPVGLDDLAGDLFGPVVKVLTTVSMVLAGVGGCAVYIETLSQILQHLLPVPVCAVWLKGAITIVEILIASLPTFKLVAYTAVIGDVCLAIALIGTLGGATSLAIRDEGSTTAFTNHTISNLPAFDSSGPAWFVFNQETMSTFFASAAFLFAVPSLLFPIENALKSPRMWKRSATTAFGLVTVLNSVFAVAAYVLVGDSTQPFIVSSLPKDVWWSTMIRIALLFDLLFTYNLTLVPSREIVEEWILGQTQAQEISAKLHGSTLRAHGGNLLSTPTPSETASLIVPPVSYWKRILTRVAINALCLALALLVPDISDLIAVGTSMALSWMTFIVGPAIVARVSWLSARPSGSFGAKKWLFMGLMCSLMVFGAVAGVSTTYLSVLSVVNDFKNEKYSICG